MTVSIKNLEKADIPPIMAAFTGSEWKTPEAYFQGRLAAQEKGEIDFLLARYGDAVAGFTTVKWRSDYPPFAAEGIPEINDLRVLAAFRRKGVAAALMDEAEKRIFEKSQVAGLGVGLYADYGAAQQLYVKRGYVPDGRGLMYNSQPVSPGRDVFVDDDLLLYFTRERPA
ncbi:MAG: GNAT family N-acetyltransferase [Dehalococcoidales bacterium]|jgi:GNAT superfamily N-acetyltransferase